jgi:hypothetical protein
MHMSDLAQGVAMGLLLGFEDGDPLVVFAGNPEDRAVPARSLVPLGPADTGAEVALLFEDGDPRRPLILGRIVDPRAPARLPTAPEAVRGTAPTTAPGTAPGPAPTTAPATAAGPAPGPASATTPGPASGRSAGASALTRPESASERRGGETDGETEGKTEAAPDRGPQHGAREATEVAPGVTREDGRLTISACDRIELRAGRAAIILEADGHVTIRGSELLSHASAANRIRGGSVNLN